MPVVWAEDAESDQYLIRHALGGVPGAPRIRFAPDGSHALQEIARKRPRLVVLDINMPVLDGIETLRRLRRDPATADLPVVIFSTARTPEEVEACQRLGIAGYVQKPVEHEKFNRAVAAIVAMAA